MISVLILTLNEEANLENCLKSVSWSDDIVVFDSFSRDSTCDIARAYGARVIQRVFDNERGQREASLQVGFKYPWVYNPDADEVTTPELRDEMQAVVSDSTREEVAYRVRFQNMFMGRWIKHSSLYPTWVMRLFRPEKIHFERAINLRYCADGPCGLLESHFLHYSFNKGIQAWLEKHVRYAMFEAEEAVCSLRNARYDWRGLTSLRDPVRRRRALKELSFRLPFRPTLRFLYMYWVRRGFLDGHPGLTYCRLLAMYEWMIQLKIQEINRQQRHACEVPPQTLLLEKTAPAREPVPF